jgi:hypothetical protein
LEALPVLLALPHVDVAKAGVRLDDEVHDQTLGALVTDRGLDLPVHLLVGGNVVGTKPRLAKAVFDAAIAGDDEPVTMLQRTALARVRDEPDPRTKLRRYGEFLAEVAPRHVPVQLVIRDAAAGDPDARTVWAELQAERLKGMTQFARALHGDGHLRAGVSIAEARDVLWTYNSAELFELLVIERKWSPKRYGRWVTDALVAALAA